MIKNIITVVFLCTLLFPWGKTGHRVTGEVAESYLTEKTKIEIAKILDDPSLAIASTWADEMRANPDFKKYNPWHYVNMPLDTKYKDSLKSDKGDLVMAIKLCKKKLKDSKVSKDEKAFYLRFLVHFVGDIHQPLHVGRSEDRGGNEIKVKWFGNDSNLHRVWDSEMINTYMMSYTEFAMHLNKNYDNRSIKIKSENQWVNESQSMVVNIYAEAKNGDYLGYDYIYENFDIVKSQLFTAGVRLALTLNAIFDE